MNKLSFKYYPAAVLVIIICLLIALKLAFHNLSNIFFKGESYSELTDVVSILLSGGTIVACLRLINQKVMCKWWLALLGIYDIRGTYIGTLTSSYHEEDNPSNPNIKLYCKIVVSQNLNGLFIKGGFYKDKKMKQPSSDFSSSYEEMEKEIDGSLRIHYFFSNKGNQLHPDNKKYGLNNHDGVCVLNYDPKTKQMEGYYFNHERASHGKLKLQLSKNP